MCVTHSFIHSIHFISFLLLFLSRVLMSIENNVRFGKWQTSRDETY